MAFPGIPNPQDVGIPAPPAASVALLRQGLAPLVQPVDAALRGILDYGTLLLAANTHTNLTGAKDWTTLIAAHLLDCVYAAQYLPPVPRILDWGSGGGLPGLVWAAIFPDKEFVLAERNRKKAAFLTAACSELGWLQVQVFAQQGEEVLSQLDPHIDWLVARAVEPLPKLLPRLARPSVPARNLFLMAGPSWQRDWEQHPQLQEQWQLVAEDAYLLAPERGQRWVLHFHKRS